MISRQGKQLQNVAIGFDRPRPASNPERTPELPIRQPNWFVRSKRASRHRTQPRRVSLRLPQRERKMLPLLKPNLLMSLQQNTAGLLVDLGILALFLVALAAK
jgi:hypothetical protein